MGQGMNNNSQKNKILFFLQLDSKGITPIDALEWCGCFRLAARISDLKKDGHNISSELETNRHGVRYSRYKLINNTLSA